MDSLHFCIAVVPLSVYLLMMGLLNLRRHPFVTTGARDAATLGIGVVGCLLYTSPSPRDRQKSRMPSSA